MCEREREGHRDRERQSVYVCERGMNNHDFEYKRQDLKVEAGTPAGKCVCVCVRERDRGRERERERESVC